MNALLYMFFISIIFAAAAAFTKLSHESIRQRARSDIYNAQKAEYIASLENKVLVLNEKLEKLHKSCPAMLLYPKSIVLAQKASKFIASSQVLVHAKIMFLELELAAKKYKFGHVRSLKRKTNACGIKGPLKEYFKEYQYTAKHSGFQSETHNNKRLWKYFHPMASEAWF